MKSGNAKELAENRKSSLEVGKKAIIISRKRAAYRTEALRLMGT
jgi:hypothetical protein